MSKRNASTMPERKIDEVTSKRSKQSQVTEAALKDAKQKRAIATAKEGMKNYNKSNDFETWVDNWIKVKIMDKGAYPSQRITNDWKLKVVDSNNNEMFFSYIKNDNGDVLMMLHFITSDSNLLIWNMESYYDNNGDTTYETVGRLGFDTEKCEEFSASLAKIICSIASECGVSIQII